MKKETHTHTHTCVNVEPQGQGHTGCEFGLLKREKKEMMRREAEARKRFDDGQKMTSSHQAT